MTEENQPLDGNEESTPDETRESEEALDLETLFQDDNLEEETVSREEFNRLQKGIKKIASQLGQTKSQTKEEPKTVQTDDLSELFFAQIPKAELVQSDLKTIADAKYGGSILKAWKGESWIQDKASALENAAKEKEVNKSKIDKPSNGFVSNKNDFSNIKNDDDVANMSPSARAKYFNEMAKKEKQP